MLIKTEFLSYAAWFQTFSGDIYTEGTIQQTMPGGEFFSKETPLTAGDSGFIFFNDLSGYPEVGAGSETPNDHSWEVSKADEYAALTKYSYDYYSAKFINAPITQGDICNRSQLNSLSNGVYRITGNANIGGGGCPGGGSNINNISRKLVFIVDGSLTINRMIRSGSTDSGFIGFIVKDNISISESLRGSESNPAVEGFFLTQKQILTGSTSSNLFLAPFINKPSHKQSGKHSLSN